jgi:hypothetical protein
LAAQTLRTSGPLSSQGGVGGTEAMKNRLHAIFTEEGKTNVIVSMYKKGERYKDIARETGLSIPGGNVYHLRRLDLIERKNHALPPVQSRPEK